MSEITLKRKKKGERDFGRMFMVNNSKQVGITNVSKWLTYSYNEIFLSTFNRLTVKLALIYSLSSKLKCNKCINWSNKIIFIEYIFYALCND